MKYNYLSILLVLVLLSCDNKDAKEKLAIENAKQVVAINQNIGVGKIIPENDIIQLSSAVNGIVQKIYKKENDSYYKKFSTGEDRKKNCKPREPWFF